MWIKFRNTHNIGTKWLTTFSNEITKTYVNFKWPIFAVNANLGLKQNAFQPFWARGITTNYILFKNNSGGIPNL